MRDLDKATTIEDLCFVLQGLHGDAKNMAIDLAMTATKYDDPAAKAKAMYYMGVMDVTEDLWSVLSGAAEADGVENTSVWVKEI